MCYIWLMAYNWQLPDWPFFAYDQGAVEDIHQAFSVQASLVSGMVSAMNTDAGNDAVIDLLVSEALKTSEIEGEYLNRSDVVSSIRNNLGLNKIPQVVKDKRAEGIGKMMVLVRESWQQPLTSEMLWSWHEALMTGNQYIRAGQWRSGTEPMQVISGAVGRETVHFEAPPSGSVSVEMEQFLQWFNETAPGGAKEIKKAVVRAAIAHLYFESIHPFEDGNGRIGRAIAEKALSQTMGRPALLSLSRTIDAARAAYYQALEQAQRSNEITPWLTYFADVALAAQIDAREWVTFVVKKARFFDKYRNELNERERKALGKMFEAGPSGFAGGMNATKYISINRTSKATATRDLQHLAAIGALLPMGAGRSVHYQLNINPV